MSYLLLVLSVLIGSGIVVVLKPTSKITRLLLSFSGAYLLSVTILHLVPEIYQQTDANPTRIGLFILIGILIQSVLESFSKGAEHGHIHMHTESRKFPLLLFISLCIHAFSEGIPIFNGDKNLLWAIVVHKIPIAIVLTTFLLQANYKKTSVFLFLFCFAAMSPLGTLSATEISFFTQHHTEITALIIGVFLHISTIILFEGSENHKFNIQKFTAILLGILVAFFAIA